MKVGTVDLQKLFKEYPGTVKAQKKFNAMAKKKAADLKEAQEDLKDFATELRSSDSVLSAKQKRQKQNELDAKQNTYLQQENQIKMELAAKENEMTQSILEELKAIVASMAKDKGVDLVLDSEKIVYLNGGIDLTDAILKSYKKSDSDSSDDTGTKKK